MARAESRKPLSALRGQALHGSPHSLCLNLPNRRPGRHHVDHDSRESCLRKRRRGEQEQLIFSRRRSQAERFDFKSAREELITLSRPVLGSSPRGLTSKSSSISERSFH